jgi:peptidoglycan/LPS O-acetylase OafA/YrhL
MFWSWAGGGRGSEQYVDAQLQFPSALPFTWFGWVGVEVFFVISGFVIANSASKSSPVEFLISRALRLYPAVWICATASLVVLVFAHGSSSELVRSYIKAMLLYPRGPWIDGVYWTLTTEIAFYALVFCALLTKRVTLLHTAWALTVYSGVYNAIALLFVSDVIQFPSLPSLVIIFRLRWSVTLLCHGCFFALGIWLFISANRKLTRPELFAVTLAFLSGAAEIFCFSSWLLSNVPAVVGQSAYLPIVVWAGAISVIAFTANRSRRSSVTVTFAPSYLRTIGLITYPLYLTHNVIGEAIVHGLIHEGLDATLAVWGALIVLIAMCGLLCSRFEPAIRALLKQVFFFLGLLPASRASLSPVSRRA